MSFFRTSIARMFLSVSRTSARHLQILPVEDRPISQVGDHLTWSVAEPEAISYASFFLLASLRALTPR